MSDEPSERVKAIPTAPDHADQPLIAALYATVTTLNGLMRQARRHEIEVTLDVTYDRVLDAYRPYVTIVELKVAKLLSNV